MKIASTIQNIDDFVEVRKLTDPKTEQRIIAALMGNFHHAYTQVSAMMPDDFSSEQWRYMFTAIRSLATRGTTVDTVTVEHELRRINKYDAVGGDLVVATVGLQFDTDISHYRDILIALSVRRQAISKFNQYISKAESDNVDITSLLSEAAQEMTHFAETSTPQSVSDKMRELSSQLLVTSRPDAIPPLVTIDQTPVLRKGDHSLIAGKEKSRKSLFISKLITDYLKNNPGGAKKVKVFDTEQDRDDVWLARERIRRATTHTVDFANMRGMRAKDRRDFISWTVDNEECDVIVIDGIRDCMKNILDVEETNDVVYWLEEMTVRRRIAICEVLHLNKTDGNVRGHIGTELANKALVTIEISYNEKTTLSEVRCKSARKKPFEPFCFTHSIDGQYQPMGVPEAPVQGLNSADAMPKTQKQQHMDAIFEGASVNYSDLRNKVSIEFGVGQRRAEQLIAKFTREGLFIKNGKAGEKETIYKLNTAPIDPTRNGVPVNEPLPAPLFDALAAEPLPDGHQPTEDLPF